MSNVQPDSNPVTDSDAVTEGDNVVAFPSRTTLAQRLSADCVHVPVTAGGAIDVDHARENGLMAQADPEAPAYPCVPGMLVNGFQRFLPDAPAMVSVIALPDGRAVQWRGEDCPEAVALVTDAIRSGATLRNIRPAGRPFAEVMALVRKAQPEPEAPASRFQITWFDQIAETDPKETFIKGVLGEGELTTVSGLPGSGKSVILTDMACHVAAGMEWHGRRVRQGLVVYIAAERKKLTERRMLAFRKKQGLEGSEPLAVLGGRLDFTSSLKDARELTAAIRGAEQQCGEKCVWIIIDTLTRTFGPGDQNASKDMGRFIQSCDVLLETGAHVTVVHHTAWSGDRGKGAIDLDGAVDSSFMVKKDGASYVLICDGANDGEEGVICRFRMEGVQVGVDEDGEPTMAPVVVPTADLAEILVANANKGQTAKALQIVTESSRQGVKLTEDEWRSAFYFAYPEKKPSTLKMAFWRARKVLLEAGTVHVFEGQYWVSDNVTNVTCDANVPCNV